jgi:hypothetical protein
MGMSSFALILVVKWSPFAFLSFFKSTGRDATEEEKTFFVGIDESAHHFLKKMVRQVTTFRDLHPTS